MPDHLIFKGYSKEKYKRTGRLPDGLYRFSVEVYDYYRNVKVSNTSTQTMWLVLNEPPLLEYPKNNTNVGGYAVQPINFQWSPRHHGSPNSAFSTQYLFELFEIRMDNMDANRAAQSLNPIYTQTCSHYVLQILPATLNLEPNIRYAWRVRAYDTQGLDMFKNNGYSEVYSFKYAIKCDKPHSLTAKNYLTNGADLQWKGDPASHTEYTLEWYNTKNEHKKYTLETALNQYRFDETLKPENTYKFRVMAKCFDITTDYTPWVELTTPTDKVEFKACEFEGDDPLPTNFQPLENLAIGDTLRYSGYDLIITEFEKLSPGTYKGRFTLWNNLKLRFLETTTNRLLSSTYKNLIPLGKTYGII